MRVRLNSTHLFLLRWCTSRMAIIPPASWSSVENTVCILWYGVGSLESIRRSTVGMIRPWWMAIQPSWYLAQKSSRVLCCRASRYSSNNFLTRLTIGKISHLIYQHGGISHWIRRLLWIQDVYDTRIVRYKNLRSLIFFQQGVTISTCCHRI